MVLTRSQFRKTQQQSAALIGSNDDLLTEILIRLPAASILLFRSVSKHWRSLLSQRHFIQRFDKLSKSPGLYTSGTYLSFNVENPSPRSFRSLDFRYDPRDIEILQSCNGLLLCCSSQGRMTGICKYYVFNPTTKQFAIIPSIIGGYKASDTVCFMGLAFHQTDCVHYKLVCIRCIGPGLKLFQIQIYSSETKKWKICEETFFMNWSFVFCKGVYWNGAIHLSPSYGNYMYFNIEAEQLHTLPLPVVITFSHTRKVYLGESRGHLHMTVDPYYDDKTMDVYEMLSDRSGWFVKYQIELNELWGPYPLMARSPYDFSVVDVVRGEKEEDTFIVLIIPKMMIRYNLHDKSLRLICRVYDYNYRKNLTADRYIESLALF